MGNLTREEILCKEAKELMNKYKYKGLIILAIKEDLDIDVEYATTDEIYNYTQAILDNMFKGMPSG